MRSIAAIDHQFAAGDEFRIVGGEIGDPRHDILWFADMADRCNLLSSVRKASPPFSDALSISSRRLMLDLRSLHFNQANKGSPWYTA